MMKNIAHNIVVISILLFTIPAFTAEPGSMISYLEHVKGLNTIMCERYVGCQKALDLESCENRLNEISEANPFNKMTFVYKNKSELCKEYLETATCDDVSGKSINGPCSLESLNDNN